jgi:hypothetical protein
VNALDGPTGTVVNSRLEELQGAVGDEDFAAAIEGRRPASWRLSAPYLQDSSYCSAPSGWIETMRGWPPRLIQRKALAARLP